MCVCVCGRGGGGEGGNLLLFVTLPNGSFNVMHFQFVVLQKEDGSTKQPNICGCLL